MAAPAPICLVCKRAPASKCKGCFKVTYCSKECQRQDWSTHRAACPKQSPKPTRPESDLGDLLSADNMRRTLEALSDSDKYLFAVGTPTPVVQEIIDVMFPDNAFTDFTTEHVRRLAETHTVHPDSIRQIAYELDKRWKQGDRFTVVKTSTGSRQRVDQSTKQRCFVDHQRRARPPRRYYELSCHRQFFDADYNNYVYLRPEDEKSEEKAKALVILSVSLEYPLGVIERLLEASKKPQVLNAAWFKELAKLTQGYMSTKLLYHICYHAWENEGATLAFEREQQEWVIRATPNSRRRQSLSMMNTETLSSNISGIPRTCSVCELPRACFFTCPNCKKLRTCSDTCQVIDVANHQARCAS